MPKFYLSLLERGIVINDPEGQAFADMDAAIVDTIRQIRSMVACEIAEKGEADLARTIEIAGPDSVVRRIVFSEAVSVSI